MNYMVAIVAIFAIFIVPIAGIALIAYFFARSARRRNELKAELYSKAIEKGVELPKELFAPSSKTQKPQRALNVGVICTSVGIGIALAFTIIGLST
jgi:hypothetical protein